MSKKLALCPLLNYLAPFVNKELYKNVKKSWQIFRLQSIKHQVTGLKYVLAFCGHNKCGMRIIVLRGNIFATVESCH